MVLNLLQQYIQGIWDDEHGPMVICFSQEQAKLLLQRDHFQVDMSFKRIRQREMNEVVFAGMMHEEGISTKTSYPTIPFELTLSSDYLRSSIHMWRRLSRLPSNVWKTVHFD